MPWISSKPYKGYPTAFNKQFDFGALKDCFSGFPSFAKQTSQQDQLFEPIYGFSSKYSQKIEGGRLKNEKLNQTDILKLCLFCLLTVRLKWNLKFYTEVYNSLLISEIQF